MLTGHLRQQARAPELLVLTKANTASTVHRGSYLDYVGVKTFDAAGQVTGEHRFLGLWTSSAYHKPPAEIPLLRRKLDAVIAHFGLPAQSHDAKSVVNVIETFPRDELFQTPVGELIASVRGIVNLYERRRVRLFVRRDSFERFYSCLVYVPRDRYNTEVRERIERIVRQRFGGTHVETQVQISDSMLARLHMLVRTPQGARPVEDIAGHRSRDRRGGRHLGRPPAAGADLARRGTQRRGTRDALRKDIPARLSRRRRARPGARRHCRSRGARGRPDRRRSSTCARGAVDKAGPPLAANPARERADLHFRHPAHAREFRAARAGRTSRTRSRRPSARCGSRTSSSKRATSSAPTSRRWNPCSRKRSWPPGVATSKTMVSIGCCCARA